MVKSKDNVIKLDDTPIAKNKVHIDLVSTWTFWGTPLHLQCSNGALFSSSISNLLDYHFCHQLEKNNM